MRQLCRSRRVQAEVQINVKRFSNIIYRTISYVF